MRSGDCRANCRRLHLHRNSRPGERRDAIKKPRGKAGLKDICRQGQMGPLPRRGENQLALISFPPKRLVAPNSPRSPNRQAASRKLAEADYPVRAHRITLGRAPIISAVQGTCSVFAI
jgi:hypothetical protein